MARTRENLNRFRKIYPQKRRSPRWFSAELRPFKLTFSNEEEKTVEIDNYTTPIIVVTPVENVNVWVYSVTPIAGGRWEVTIKASTRLSADVHVHVGEGTL